MVKVKTKQLLKLIDEKGLIQYKVGEFLGYAGRTGRVKWNRIIHNSDGATFDQAKASNLADILGVPVDTILNIMGLGSYEKTR